MKKTIGIIGGMDPLATCDLMEKIISLTDAKRDQDNIHLVVDCSTNIPDRTEAILEWGCLTSVLKNGQEFMSYVPF